MFLLSSQRFAKAFAAFIVKKHQSYDFYYRSIVSELFEICSRNYCY